MPVPTFTAIAFDKDDNPYDDGAGYIEKWQQLSANFTTLAAYVAEVEFSVEQTTQNIIDQTAEDRGVIEGLITSTVGTLTAAVQADRVLAQSAATTSTNNALAAAAAVQSISDYSARVQAMLMDRGTTNIKGIAFSSSDGTEKQGNQAYKAEPRPTGRNLGSYANAAAAWGQVDSTPASANEDWYYNTTDTFWYKLSGGNSHTRIYRAGSAHLPLERVAVASGSGTSLRLQIFDLTDPLMPMWKEWVAGVDFLISYTATPANASISQIVWHDGALWIAQNGSTAPGLLKLDFKTGNAFFWGASTHRYFSKGLSVGTSANPMITINTTSTLSSSTVHSIAAHKGYIAADTAAGVSVIKPDGTVLKDSGAADPWKAVDILNGRAYTIRDNTNPEQLHFTAPVDELGAGFSFSGNFTNATVPALSASTLTSIGKADSSLIILSASAVDQLWPNPTVPADSLIARRGLTYATPPMKKPEVMLICSTVGGAVSDAELVTNGDFSDGTTGWLESGGSSTISATGGIATITRKTGSGFVGRYRSFPTTPGKRYRVTGTRGAVSGAGGVALRVYLTGSGSGLALEDTNASVTGTFVAQTAASYVNLSSTGGAIDSTFEYSNISIEEVVEDFSGLNKHGTINGTLSAVAEVTGGVAGLTGFDSSADFVEAPNPWAGIGTGEGWIAFAFKMSGAAVESLLEIAYESGGTYSGARLWVYSSATNLVVRASADGNVTNVQAISQASFKDSLVHTVVIRKSATHYYLDVDDEEFASIAIGAHGNLSFNAAAKFLIGKTITNSNTAPNSTIWLAGGGKTALSDAEVQLMHTHMRNLILGKASLDEIPTISAYDRIRKAVEMVGATKRQTLQAGAIISSVTHGRGSSAVVAVGPRSEIGIGGSTGVTASAPERNLREYTPRLTTERVTYDYVANGTDTVFPPLTNAAEIAKVIGARPVQVVDAGSVIPEDVAGWTLADYGLGRLLPKFAVAPSDTNIVSITFEREVYK
jgi:hypothetical protein